MNPEDQSNAPYNPVQQQPTDVNPGFQPAGTPPPAFQNPAPAPAPAPKNGNTIAVVALVLAVVGILIPILPVVGLILGIIGLSKSRSVNGEKKGLAIAAIVVSLLALCLHTFVVAKVVTSVDKRLDETKLETANRTNSGAGSSIKTSEDNTCIATTTGLLKAVENNQIDQAYGLFSEAYQQKTSKQLFKSVIFDFMTTRSVGNAKPVWKSTLSAPSGNKVNGVVYSATGVPRSADPLAYYIFTLDSSCSKILRYASVNATGKQMTDLEKKNAQRAYLETYPSGSVSTTIYDGQEIVE